MTCSPMARVLAVLVATVLALAGLASTPVAAVPTAPNAVWTISDRPDIPNPPGGITLDSDGSSAPARLSYNIPYGAGANDNARYWHFLTVADADGTVELPYHWTGNHGFDDALVGLYGVRIRGGAHVGDAVLIDKRTDAGPLTPPEQVYPGGAFDFSGSHVFNVQAGDLVGFGIAINHHDNVPAFGSFAVDVPSPFVDPGAIAANTSWTNATLLTASGADGTLAAPGEARWYKFPVVPTEQVSLALDNAEANYDLTLYSDIGAKFTELSSTTDLNWVNQEQGQLGPAFAPSVYSPSVYSPSVYSPSVYSPSVYSPSVYSPSVYSPSVYSPSVYSPSVYSPSVYSPSDAFLQAFYGAQAQSLVAVSANDGIADESVRTSTWTNTGYYYVRVQGRNGASGEPFHLGLSKSGGPCTGVTLDSFAGADTLAGTPGSAQTIILTDSSRMNLDVGSLRTQLTRLATATGGVVVDVDQSERVRHLNDQADANPACSYTKNMVAGAIREIVNSYRDADGTAKYVVLVGGDDVIPYFRYRDAAGIGPEQNYVPPVLDDTASQASLKTNYTLGQDAYGSVTELSVNGSTLPVPDLAVGRLVETPAEIDGQITQFLGLANQTLPTPTSSLVTGYDFLTGAADSVQGDLRAGLGPSARTDALITDQGVPTTTTTGPSGPSRSASWTAADLSDALLGSQHDIVFLAGHFSANSTLAADYESQLIASEVDAHPGLFTNSLVFSPGCHSGYNLLDAEAVPGVSEPLDWAQVMARQRAIFVAGTGYQYADTNFLAYSAKLYAEFAHQLRVGEVGDPVGIGSALVDAKRAYLAETTDITGLDEKSIIEAALYGLPMTGIDLPSGRTGYPTTTPTVTPSDAPAGTPGAVLGLKTETVTIDTPTTAETTPVLDLSGNPTGASFGWLEGADGVHAAPALPALPQQFIDATAPGGASLRGIGFRTGVYTDTPGQVPLTGAPTTEQNGVHTTFASPVFFPQELASANYFDALGTTGASGRTRLIMTPAQYRAEDAAGTTSTLRAYSSLGLELFYSDNTQTYGQNTPALAAPPSISQVTATADPSTHSLRFAAHVTGDPSAGIQQVWVTYTGESEPLHGSWASIDLTQDPADSTLWSGTLELPPEVAADDVRFMVQAANGVGLVGLDNNVGALYTPGIDPGAPPAPDAVSTQLVLDAPPASAPYGSSITLRAVLTGAPAGAPVAFDIGQGPVTVPTDANGVATLSVRLDVTPGTYPVTATYAGDADHRPSAAERGSLTVTKAPTTVDLKTTNSRIVALSGLLSRMLDTGIYAVVKTNGVPLPGKAVRFLVTNTLLGRSTTITRTTDLNGRATLGPIATRTGTVRITAEFGTGATGTAVDPVYRSSTSRSWSGLLLAGAIIRLP